MKKQFQALLVMLFSVLFTLSLTGCFVNDDSDTGSDTQTEISDNTSEYQTDETAPVVTFAEHGDLTVKVGETLRLPEAFATDDTDGDVTAQLVPLAADNGPEIVRAEDAEGCVYDFTCHAKGVYRVAYKVVDNAGNNGTGVISVIVTADRDDETEISDAENKLENLLVDGGVYSENFAKGYNSPLAEYGLPQGMYLSTESDAIAGTSLIVNDFSSIIKFYSIAAYTNSEAYYYVSFDVKLVSGTGANNFYVSFAESENEQGVSDTRFPLGDLQVGNVITFDSSFRVFGANKYYFRLFVYNEEPDMVIAIDNIKIIYRAPVETYVPTSEEIEAGYTWDWSENKMDVSFGEIVDRPVALAENSGYGEKVLKLSFPVGNGPQFFGTNGIFVTGYTYLIDFDYYTEPGVVGYNVYYHIITTTTTTIGNFTAVNGESKHSSVSFVAQDGDRLFCLYLAGTTDGTNAEFYIGNFTVRVLPKYTVTFVSEGETVSEQKVTLNCAAVAPVVEREGYTFVGWDKEFDNVTEDIVVTAIWRENNNFVKPVIVYTGEDSYSVNKGDYVDIAVTASDDIDGDITSSIEFTTEDGGNVIYDENKQAYRFYATRSGNYTVVCTVKDSSSNNSDPVSVSIAVDGIADDFSRDSKYIWNWTDNMTSVTCATYPNSIVARPDIATLTAADSGFSEKVLYVEWTAGGDSLRFEDTSDIITEGHTYIVRYKIYVPADSGHFNVYYCVFDTTTTSLGNFSNGYSKDVVLDCSAKFTAQPGDNMFALYCAGVMALGDDAVSKCYIGDLTIEEYFEPCTEIDCDWTDNVTKVQSNYQCAIVDRPDVEALKAADSGFSEKVLYIEWTGGGDSVRFPDSTDFITAGKTYEVDFKVYVPVDSGHFNVYYCVFDTTTTSLGNFSNGMDKGIIINCHVSFTAQSGDNMFALYCAGVMALGDDAVSKCYIGDLTVKELSDTNKIPAATLLAEVGGKATTDFEDYEGLESAESFRSIYHEGGGTVTVEYNGVMGSKALHIDNTQNNGNNAHFLNAVLPVGIYKVSFDLLVANYAYAGQISIELGEKYTPSGYVDMRIPKNEVLRVTKYFEITENSDYKYLVIWTGLTDMYIDNLEIERVETKVEGISYVYKIMLTEGGSIAEDFETAYTGNDDCKLGNIYATAAAEVKDDNGNSYLEWTTGMVYCFYTQNYLPAGTYSFKMRVKKLDGEAVNNLYIGGTQVDSSLITTEWAEVTYTVTVQDGQLFTFDSSANPGYCIDDIVVTRI